MAERNLGTQPRTGARRFPLSAALAFALIAAACGGGSGPIVIGLAGPFSEERGRSMQLAAELAVREINAAGGVRGRELQLAIENDSAQNARAIAVATRLKENPDVLAVIGHLTSGTTIAAADIYNAPPDPVVEISPSASNPDLTGLGRYTFRVCATDLLHGTALARFAFEALGLQRAAVLYLNDDYGRGILGTFSQEFERLGGRILEQDPYLSSTADFSPYLERIQRAAEAELLMIAGDRATAVRILRQARQRGLALPVMGGDALTGIQAEGELSEGVYYSSNYLPDRPGERNAAFLRAYAAAYGGQRPDHRGAGAYDAVYLIADAIRVGGTSRRAVRDALAAVGQRRSAYDGVTGRIAFDDRGDVPDKSVVIGRVRGGAIVPVESRE
jgi:branched-chain amino acid transport system substrate-binding protein